jgi:hypothetical protein
VNSVTETDGQMLAVLNRIVYALTKTEKMPDEGTVVDMGGVYHYYVTTIPGGHDESTYYRALCHFMQMLHTASSYDFPMYSTVNMDVHHPTCLVCVSLV